MNREVLQIPINKNLRDVATKNASHQGFSSLQEVIRIFVNKFAKNEIQFGFINPVVDLSEKNEKRYLKMIDDFEKGKNISKKFTDVDSLMKELRK